MAAGPEMSTVTTGLAAFKHGICQLVLRARQTHIRGIHTLAAIHLQFRTDDCRRRSCQTPQPAKRLEEPPKRQNDEVALLRKLLRLRNTEVSSSQIVQPSA